MASHGIVFLMYHELESPGRGLCQSEPGYVRYVLPQKQFRAQIAWLRENGWSGFNVSEALSFTTTQAVAITFDDGCETDFVTATPILKEAGFNATFYITAGRIGKKGYMSPVQLRELSSLALEIGCHSMSHVYLNDLNPSDLRREIVDAGKTLEDLIGKKVEHFSCPGGRYDSRTIAVVQEAGYRTMATSPSYANSPSTNPFLLGRVAILRSFNDAAFEGICTGRALLKMRLLESVRSGARNLFGNVAYDRLRALMLREPSGEQKPGKSGN
jgi:peptidoglycan/xylan/chitin deacetylase (PgdA/CDA1 family)